ncbi:MAG: hypothetical protein ACLQHS_10245 [Candidatus Limnocylindrales bacterium]
MRAITARHVKEWQIVLLEQWKPATAHNRFRELPRFFSGYTEREGDLRSPMLKTRPTHLLSTSHGSPRWMNRGGASRLCRSHLRGQDAHGTGAGIFQHGARRDETANLRHSPADRDVVLDRGPVRLFSKGSRERFARIDDHTVDAL